jgi:hypothetical protein
MRHVRQEHRVHAAGIGDEARAIRAQERAQVLEFLLGVHGLSLPPNEAVVERPAERARAAALAAGARPASQLPVRNGSGKLFFA